VAFYQDVDFMTNKMAAIVVEQRETRNHWLREKTELEGRIFQIQALNTQFQGSLRKKEKDYERLQLQLEKLVKDSNRGTQKSSVIMISKPLPKNSSQGSKQPGTLKDAELTASKTIIASLEVPDTIITQSHGYFHLLLKCQLEKPRNVQLVSFYMTCDFCVYMVARLYKLFT
jgi:hypothetical protein